MLYVLGSTGRPKGAAGEPKGSSGNARGRWAETTWLLWDEGHGVVGEEVGGVLEDSLKYGGMYGSPREKGGVYGGPL